MTLNTEGTDSEHCFLKTCGFFLKFETFLSIKRSIILKKILSGLDIFLKEEIRVSVQFIFYTHTPITRLTMSLGNYYPPLLKMKAGASLPANESTIKMASIIDLQRPTRKKTNSTAPLQGQPQLNMRAILL